MRRKVSTVLDENLYRRAKIEAVRQEKTLSDVLTEALETYLGHKGSPQGVGGVVSASKGVLRIDKKLLRKIMEEEPDWLEARWRS